MRIRGIAIMFDDGTSSVVDSDQLLDEAACLLLPSDLSRAECQRLIGPVLDLLLDGFYRTHFRKPLPKA
jgi:hypothetical protein